MANSDLKIGITNGELVMNTIFSFILYCTIYSLNPKSFFEGYLMHFIFPFGFYFHPWFHLEFTFTLANQIWNKQLYLLWASSCVWHFCIIYKMFQNQHRRQKKFRFSSEIECVIWKKCNGSNFLAPSPVIVGSCLLFYYSIRRNVIMMSVKNSVTKALLHL